MPVLHDIEFRVGEGEMVAVTGPNGAGKSTLMKSISGTVTLMAGRIYYRDQDITRARPLLRTRMGIRFVPQERNVFGDLTVEENLDIACSLPGARDEKAKLFEFFPVLGERRRQRASTLSGGERQMLAIACAIAGRADLLLLDEPTAGLSPQALAEVTRLVREINRQGTAVVWVVEENPKQVISHSDRLYLLEGGTVKLEGDAQRLLDTGEFDRVYLSPGQGEREVKVGPAGESRTGR